MLYEKGQLLCMAWSLSQESPASRDQVFIMSTGDRDLAAIVQPNQLHDEPHLILTDRGFLPLNL